MKKTIWILFALFVLGNSFFVLPIHFSRDVVDSKHILNYKKDSVLLHAVFQDSTIALKLKMPTIYHALYYGKDTPPVAGKQTSLLVNVSFLDNLDFFSLIFPFYKSTNVKGQIDFYSKIKIEDQPGMDSIALIGNLTIQIRVGVTGICTPQYVRTLVEKQVVDILRKEMAKVEKDMSSPVVIVDSSTLVKPVKTIRPTPRGKAKKRR